jgi:hypothetical protein
VLGIYARLGFGVVFAAGYVALVWDLVTLGHRAAVRAVPAAAE